MKNKGYLITLALLIFLPAILLGVADPNVQRKDSLLKKTPTEASASLAEAKSTIQGFVDALRDHDLSRAYYAFTTRNFRSVTSKTGFQGFIFDNPVMSQNSTMSFYEPVPQNDLIIVKTMMTSIDNKKGIVEFALKLEDNKWRILGIKTFPAP